jgi:hypothetical protein
MIAAGRDALLPHDIAVAFNRPQIQMALQGPPAAPTNVSCALVEATCLHVTWLDDDAAASPGCYHEGRLKSKSKGTCLHEEKKEEDHDTYKAQGHDNDDEEEKEEEEKGVSGENISSMQIQHSTIDMDHDAPSSSFSSSSSLNRVSTNGLMMYRITWRLCSTPPMLHFPPPDHMNRHGHMNRHDPRTAMTTALTTSRSFVIRQLVPWTFYSITVQASIDQGTNWSRESDPRIVQTAAAVPTAPKAPSITRVTNKTIAMYFMLPESNNGCPLEQVSVQMQQTGSMDLPHTDAMVRPLDHFSESIDIYIY